MCFFVFDGKKGVNTCECHLRNYQPFLSVFCFVDSNVWMTHFIVKHSFLVEMFFITKNVFSGKFSTISFSYTVFCFPLVTILLIFFLFVECHTVCGWTTNKKGLNQQWCNYYRQQQKRHFFYGSFFVIQIFNLVIRIHFLNIQNDLRLVDWLVGWFFGGWES